LVSIFSLKSYKHITTVHGIIKKKFLPLTLRERFYIFLDYSLSFMNSHTIAVSNFTKKELCTTIFFNKNKVSVIYNISFNEPELLIKKKNKLNKHICFIGRLEPEKGIDFLISIIETYLSINKKDIVFDICGDGTLAFKIERLFLKYPKNIVFHGYVQNSSIILNQSSLLISTSIVETFGLVILEAFNHKVPVIATNVGGVPEIIKDNINGFLVQYGKVDNFIQKIDELINNDELATRFVTKATDVLNNKFSIDTSICQYKNILAKI